MTTYEQFKANKAATGLIQSATAYVSAKAAEKASEIENPRERAEHLKAIFPDFTVTLTGSWVWVKGDTKPHREALKLQGCKWSKNRGSWYVPGERSAKAFYKKGRTGVSMSHIISKYGTEEIS